MKRFKYSLVAAALATASMSSFAATYQVVDLQGVAQTHNSYAMGLNAQGDVVGTSTGHYHYPINVDELDFDLLPGDLASQQASYPGVFDDVNLDDIANGIFNAQGVSYIKNYFERNWLSPLIQKVGDRTGFIVTGDGLAELDLFDQVVDGFGGKTRSTMDIPYAINDHGAAVASATALYTKVDFTTEPTENFPEPDSVNIWRKSFLDRKAVVSQNGQTTVIEPEFTQFGGSTIAVDISNSNYVVGYAATGLSATAVLQIANTCPDLVTDDAKLQCGWEIKNNMAANATTGSTPFFDYQAYRWTLDDNMQVIATLAMGMLLTPEDTDTASYTSMATGVNEQGHMSGYSSGYSDHPAQTGTKRNMAVYHDGIEYHSILDHDGRRYSSALDINDNDVLVGYMESRHNGSWTKQFFHYDATTATVTYPAGFFESSASVAHAVNNNGIIVGKAEVQFDLVTNRREHGFVYDMNTQVISDLNDLTECNSPYRIVEAKDINDDGVIVGTALMDANSKDALGNDIIGDDGNPVTESVARAVKLLPIAGGSIDNCDSDHEETSYERKGAGFGGFGLLLLGGLLCVRRLVRPGKSNKIVI